MAKAPSATNRKLLATLAELGGSAFRDDDIRHEGKQIILPENLTLRQSIDFLSKKYTEQEEITTFQKIFNYRPWDGAICAFRAMHELAGMVGHTGQTHQGFFGPIKDTARMISVTVGPNETEQVPWGAFSIPVLENCEITFGGVIDPEKGILFQVAINGPKKLKREIEGLFRFMEDYMQRNSIYRGKAIDGAEEPNFLDLSGVKEESVVYSADVRMQLNANVWGMIEHSELNRNLGMPMKRAVLLAGPYGTGKTLTAYLTAQKAVANGWTFLFCRPDKDSLETVIQTGRLYQPAVIHFEDMDTLWASGDKDITTRMLDIFDGIQSKGTEILCVLTTNHPERIHKGMLRPGRLDAFVTLGALDHPGVQKLCETTVGMEHLDPDLNWEKVGEAMEGYLPSFVKEAAVRAVRYAIARSSNGSGLLLDTADFVGAAEGLRPQLALMNQASEAMTAHTVERAMRKMVEETLEPTVELVKEIHSNTV